MPTSIKGVYMQSEKRLVVHASDESHQHIEGSYGLDNIDFHDQVHA